MDASPIVQLPNHSQSLLIKSISRLKAEGHKVPSTREHRSIERIRDRNAINKNDVIALGTTRISCSELMFLQNSATSSAGRCIV